MNQDFGPKTCHNTNVIIRPCQIITVCVCLVKVPVQSWFDDMNDTELRDLLPFFEGLSKEEDVYGVLQNLRGR